MPPLTPSSVSSVSGLVSFHLATSRGAVYYPKLSPAEDTYLPTQYTARNIVQRKKNQAHLRGVLHVDNHLPLVGVIVGGLCKKEQDVLVDLIDASQFLPLQLVLIADNKECSPVKGSTIKQLIPTVQNTHLFFGAADILLLPVTCDDTLVASCFRYGLVPVVYNDQALVRDYDPVSEEGNAFTYEQSNVWSIYAALVRAIETNRLSYDWLRIQRNGVDMSA